MKEKNKTVAVIRKNKSHVITLYPNITLYLPVYSASQQDSSPLEAMHPARTQTCLKGKIRYAAEKVYQCVHNHLPGHNNFQNH